ncbi:LADA_0H00254g1_1 [Lachancea dasiensis]|uniref:LADA_0H00254g1_1 n=1 Tax=Lachancea dasiensis TaxID=1072105 RepID=A0A1G4JYR5_9SACH|nr:LADA_0H00254g1_1 [Lachancea dasiensis]
MDEFDLISQLLLRRSQETLQQLDERIEKQRNLHSAGKVNTLEDLNSSLQAYYVHLSQLNDLYFWAQSIQADATVSQKSIAAAELLQELDNISDAFQEQTATTLDLNASPSSAFSFQPRPLKIIERRHGGRKPESPAKVPLDAQPSYPPLRTSSSMGNSLTYSNSWHSSPPRSPIPTAQPRYVRGAKSCDAGLNRANDPHENRLSFFKDRQRLSISFVEDDEYSSDEETVISPSPVNTPFLKNNTVAGSSVLRKAVVKEANNFGKAAQTDLPVNGTFNLPRLLPKTPTVAQCRITSVDYKPEINSGISVYSGRTSRELLFKVATTKSQNKNTTKSKVKTKSWFNDGQLLGTIRNLNNQVQVTSETGTERHDPLPAAKMLKQSRRPFEYRQPPQPYGSIIIHGPSGSKFVTAPRQTELHFKVSHDALRDALNSDII